MEQEHMNLKDFIRVSLVQIAEGASEANQEMAPLRAQVNPQGLARADASTVVVLGRKTNPPVEMVEFDVAVETSAESGKKGGLDLRIASFGGATADRATSTSRLKFTVPLMLPRGDGVGT